MGYKITVLPGDGIGPEITDSAIEILEQVAQSFSEISVIDKKPSLEGRKMFLILSPR